MKEGRERERETETEREMWFLSCAEEVSFRYFEDVKHIEIQIFGDKHGNVVHVFEVLSSLSHLSLSLPLSFSLSLSLSLIFFFSSSRGIVQCRGDTKK
jgi:hypothetical protein